MDFATLKQEILQLIQIDKVEDALLKLGDLDKISNKDFKLEVDSLDKQWLNYKNALYLEVYTKEQVRAFMKDAVGEVLAKIYKALKAQGIKNLDKAEVELPDTLKPHMFQTEQDSLKSHSQLRESLYEKSAIDEKIAQMSIKRPLLVSIFCVFGIAIYFLQIVLTLFGKIEYSSPVIQMGTVGLNVLSIALLIGIWGMRRIANFLYVAAVVAKLIFFLKFLGDIPTIYFIADLIPLVYILVFLYYTSKMR